MDGGATTAQTEPHSNSRAKHWTITVNNWTNEDVSMFEDLKQYCDYFVFGKEIGASGTPHLQCYIAFSKQKSFKYLKQCFPRSHIEVMAAKNPADAANYCKKGIQSKAEWNSEKTQGKNFGKDAEFIEYGEVPEPQSKKGGKATKAKWDSIKSHAKAGELEEIDSQVYVLHYRNLKAIKYDHQIKPPTLPGTAKEHNEWLYGETDAGKSYTARKEHPALFDKMLNKWWDHYNGEEVVLLDDFDITHECLGSHLKRWADIYSFPIEIKNHVTFIRPKKIIVTSQYLPEEIFKNAKMAEAVRRRFTFRHIMQLKRKDIAVNQNQKKKLKVSNQIKKHDKIIIQKIQKPPLYRQNATGNLEVNTIRQLRLQPQMTGLPLQTSTTTTSSTTDVTKTTVSTTTTPINILTKENKELIDELVDEIDNTTKYSNTTFDRCPICDFTGVCMQHNNWPKLITSVSRPIDISEQSSSEDDADPSCDSYSSSGYISDVLDTSESDDSDTYSY